MLSLIGCGSGIAGTAATTVASLQIPSALPSAVSGMMYNSSLQSDTSNPHLSWSVVSGTVPAGLELQAKSGVISGVPQSTGTAEFAVSVKDDLQASAAKTVPVSITVLPQLTAGNTTMPAAKVGSAFMKAIAVSGGKAPYSWSAPDGQLPPGVAMRDGIFLGVPTATGSYRVTYQVSDSASPKQVLTLPITIQVDGPLSVAAVPAQKVFTGTPFALSLLASGGTPGYTWSVAGGSLPTGLGLSPSGIISGIPTAAGNWTATLAVQDQNLPFPTGTSTTVAFSVSSGLVLQTPTFGSATVNTPYNAAFLVSGGTPGYAWTSAGSLPPGISLNNSGALSGTPTSSGSYSFTVQVADSGSPSQVRTATATINVANQAQALTAGTTWYVRKDGGTRYSANRTSGQCDGKSDAPYSGIGVNQHCAFNDVRYLWQDGSYISSVHPSWIIAGGDTVIIRGSLENNITYRIGWNNKSAAYEAETDTFLGVVGDPYGSGMPVPPSGTPAQHTRILGENYGSCHTQTKRTQLHGGFGVSSVLDLHGASYVDVQCLDITDFSACGRSAQTNSCQFNPGTLDDYAANGITVDKNTNHINVTDVRIHGMAVTGMYGPTGDGNVFNYFDIIGNPGAGWNADNGTVGVGSTLVQNFNISWNGCAEEYPIQSALPYNDCTDDNSGGYGDGFGTATIKGTSPWNVTFDTGTVSYNTQDGLDALHLVGAGSTMTINRVMAYGNMGQQIKVGGAGGVATNNVIVTNCNAMRQSIPGAPDGFNRRLSDFCRAADAGVVMSVQDGSKTQFNNNTVYSASSTAIEIDCGDGASCNSGTDQIDFRNNIILGFKNSAATGYVNGGTNDYSNPIYVGGLRTFQNSGSVFDHNLTYHAKSNWSCPNNPGLRETNAMCADPGLVDETWHNYGVGTMSPVPGASLAIGAGITISGLTISFNGQTRATPPTIGAYE